MRWRSFSGIATSRAPAVASAETFVFNEVGSTAVPRSDCGPGSLPQPFISHEGGFSPDGNRMYLSNLGGSPSSTSAQCNAAARILSFDNFRVPATAMLGEEGKGFYSARAIGLARAALEDSIAYLHTRRQFARELADFQHLRFKVAAMAADIEAARQLTYAVATDIDTGRRCSLEASMCKLVATEMTQMRISTDELLGTAR